jgi:uncharacterized protein
MAENTNLEQSNFSGASNNGQSQDAAASPVKRTANRGFAAMDPARQKEIARAGGRAAHVQGVAHQWTSEEAREAGRKGGQNSRGRRSGPGQP